MNTSMTEESIAFILTPDEARAIQAKLEGRIGDIPPRYQQYVADFESELEKFV